MAKNLDKFLDRIKTNYKISNIIGSIVTKNSGHSFGFNKVKQISQVTPILIEEIDCANNAINVVPKFCSAILNISDSVITNNAITSIKKIIEKYNFDIDIYKIDDSHIKLTSYGTAAHSSHPELGVNAISKLIIVLNNLFKEFHISFKLFEDFCKFIGDDYSGKGLNINFADESGALTLNVAQLYIENNKVNIGINLRVPVHTKPEIVTDVFKNKFQK